MIVRLCLQLTSSLSEKALLVVIFRMRNGDGDTAAIAALRSGGYEGGDCDAPEHNPVGEPLSRCVRTLGGL